MSGRRGFAGDLGPWRVLLIDLVDDGHISEAQAGPWEIAGSFDDAWLVAPVLNAVEHARAEADALLDEVNAAEWRAIQTERHQPTLFGLSVVATVARRDRPSSLFRDFVASGGPYARSMTALLATDRALLDHLERGGTPEPRWALTLREDADPGRLSRLVSDPVADVRLGVAHHSATGPAELRRLATDDDPRVRRTIASRSDLAPDLLEQLCRDRQASVRKSAAGNPSLPSEQIDELTLDSTITVRATIAKRGDLPPRMLIRLAADASPRVRRELLSLRHPPAAVLAALAMDQDEDIATAAQEAIEEAIGNEGDRLRRLIVELNSRDEV